MTNGYLIPCLGVCFRTVNTAKGGYLFPRSIICRVTRIYINDVIKGEIGKMRKDTCHILLQALLSFDRLLEILVPFEYSHVFVALLGILFEE